MNTLDLNTQQFSDIVLALTAQIPCSKVTTYGHLAAKAGSPNAARAVGSILRNNPNLIKIPCHRVVAVDGSLTGYAGNGGILTKKKLLQSEGVSFVGEKVNMKISLWCFDSKP